MTLKERLEEIKAPEDYYFNVSKFDEDAAKETSLKELKDSNSEYLDAYVACEYYDPRTMKYTFGVL